MADLVDITDPADARLADYRDLRDVSLRKHLEAEHGLFLAEGEKVVRRAVEAGFAPRSFLMAPRWLDGLADVLASSDAPCYVVSEALAEQVTGFHVHRGALASLRRTPLPSVVDGAGRRSVGAGARGRRRPHQRRCDLPQRRGARLRRRTALAALRRPAVPPVDQGRHGRGLHAAVDPPAGLGDGPSRPVGRGLHDRGADPGAGRRRDRGRRPRSRQGRPGARRSRATASRPGGSRPPTGAPSSR